MFFLKHSICRIVSTLLTFYYKDFFSHDCELKLVWVKADFTLAFDAEFPLSSCEFHSFEENFVATEGIAE